MREDLVIKALTNSLKNRALKLKGMIVHSDRGGQYASKAFRKLLKRKRILQSMSWSDDPVANAFAESYFSRMKAEMPEEGAFDSVEDARSEIFSYIEM